MAAIRLALAAVLLGDAVQAVAADTWFRITDEQRQMIGWQRESIEAIPEGRRLTRERVTAFRIKDHDPARLTVRVVRDEAPDGTLLSLTQETRRNRQESSLRVVMAGSTMLVESRRGKDVTMRQALRDPALRLGDDEWLSGPPVLGELLEIEPGTSVFQRGMISRAGPEVPGGEEALLHSRDGQLTDIWVVTRDARGEVIRAEKPLPGGSQVFERSPGPVRAEELSPGRPVASLRFKSPFAISESALKGHIRYTFRPRAGAPLDLPQTGEQRVKSMEDGTLRLDICDTCGPGLPDDAESLAAWRRPSAWIESDAPEFAAIAVPIAARKIPERTRMRLLGAAARRRLAEVQFFGHYSAREAWRRRSGDCTEGANVYAALARSAGIPARVVNGLVFMRERYFGSENAFQPHSWVVAFVDGKWESFDISVGAFDATHIALSFGDGEPGAILSANRKAGMLKWEAMAEVRKR